MATIKDKAAIVGIGDVPFTTNSGMSELEMLLQASRLAIDDAGLRVSDIDGVIGLSNNVTAEDYIASLGLKNVTFSVSVLRAEALCIVSLQAAALAIASGQARSVLVAQGRNFATEAHITLSRREGGAPQQRKAREFNHIYGESTSFIHHALAAREHMDRYGTTEEHLAKIVVNQRRHASLNPNSLTRRPMTRQEYFRKPYVVEPLRAPDALIYADSGGAWIVSSASAARDLKQKPVLIAGVAATFSEFPYAYSSLIDEGGEHPLDRATRKAYKMAGVGPKDIDFAQLYDSFSLLVMEQLGHIGVCAPDEVRQWLDDTSLAFDGDGLPVNTHGGHIAQGMAQGQSHLLEAVRQLRGQASGRQVKNAAIGLVGTSDGGALILRT